MSNPLTLSQIISASETVLPGPSASVVRDLMITAAAVMPEPDLIAAFVHGLAKPGTIPSHANAEQVPPYIVGAFVGAYLSKETHARIKPTAQLALNLFESGVGVQDALNCLDFSDLEVG